MDIKTAIEKAGGNASIARACRARGMALSVQRIGNWKVRGKLPASEWTGDTSVAPVICDLIKVFSGEDIHPRDLCPGAGQYMQHPDTEAA